MSETEFDALKAKWSMAADAQWELGYQMRSKYGTDLWDIYAPKYERTAYERFRRAEHKAAEAMYRWLDKYTPRADGWRAGTSMIYVREKLTFTEAMTTTDYRDLPRESRAYGY